MTWIIGVSSYFRWKKELTPIDRPPIDRRPLMFLNLVVIRYRVWLGSGDEGTITSAMSIASMKCWVPSSS